MSPKIRAMLDEARRKALGPEVPVPKPKPAVTETVVEVARSDPNYTPENRGKVKVTVRRPESYEPDPDQIIRAEEKARERLNRVPIDPTNRRVYDEMYWAEVDRLMAAGPSPVALVVSNYNPFARERMPGYDPNDE